MENIEVALAAAAGAFALVLCLWAGIRAWVSYDEPR